MVKTQLTLYLKNQPGELARALAAFSDANINIEGISIAASTHVSLVQIIVSDASAARQLLREADIALSSQEITVLVLPNRPGALARMASKLASQEVNIDYLYATSLPDGSGDACSMVISADDLERVEALWQE